MPEFIRYYLIGSKDYLQSKASGTTFLELSGTSVGQLEIPIAPLNEQRRIADKIDELFSQIEAGEQALARAQKLLERYRQSVLNAAVTGELTRDWRQRHQGELESGEALLKRILQARREAWENTELAKLHARGKPPTDDRWKQKYKEPEPPDTTELPDLPEDWVWVTVEQLSLLVTDGDHNPPSRAKCGIPHLTAKNIIGGRLNFSGCTFVTDAGFEQTRSRYEPRKDDLIVTCVGTIGRTAVIPTDDVFSADRNLAAIRVVPRGALVAYVKMVIDAPDQQIRVMSLSGSTAQPHLYLKDLRSFPIPLPSSEEQARIVEGVEECLSAMEVNEAGISEELRRTAALRQSILNAAFAGKLVPQDPADEPASVLLERIREERAAADSPRPRRSRQRPRAIDRKVGEQLELLG